MNVNINFIRAVSVFTVLLGAGLGAAGVARADAPAAREEADAQRLVHILSYVAADYGGAVADGRVRAFEYSEFLFVAGLRASLAGLPFLPTRGARGSDLVAG